jgi:hypothetical protein
VSANGGGLLDIWERDGRENQNKCCRGLMNCEDSITNLSDPPFFDFSIYLNYWEINESISQWIFNEINYKRIFIIGTFCRKHLKQKLALGRGTLTAAIFAVHCEIKHF